MADYDIASSPYDEDEIVKLITQIFDKHVQLCYFWPGDLIYPTETSTTDDATSPVRHAFSSSVRSCFSDLNLSARVISLLERIPYLAPNGSAIFPFYHPDSILTCPEHTENLRLSRDPHGIQTGRAHSRYMSPMLFPSDVALVLMDNREGRTVILDTEANTIRVYANYEGEPDIPEDLCDTHRKLFEFPDQPGHYRNYKPVCADFFLRSWLEDIDLLRIIPWRADGGVEGPRLAFCPRGKWVQKAENGVTLWEDELADDGLVDEKKLGRDVNDDYHDLLHKTYHTLKSILRLDYGWAGNFQAERWANECEERWREVNDRYMIED